MKAASNSCEFTALVWKSFAWLGSGMHHCSCSELDCISIYHHCVPRGTEELVFISGCKTNLQKQIADN